ncbi:MAG: hypothetical protein CME26_01105 [Gemmatimonadetes bacterium]|nr:hypothetical protein [Gemmatimonadota bacterium]
MVLSFCSLGTVVLVSEGVYAANDEALTLRQEYNTVTARIDSLVRTMGVDDRNALDTTRLPEELETSIVPDGRDVVLIFWADDEAKVWVNDYFVGETRLTPIEVIVPSLYLRSTNRIRVRCWDTDWVESGLLLGLYLRGEGGTLHPIVTSDASWEGVGGSVEEIAYAHSLPDIPDAEVVWGPRVFGLVEMTKSFDRTHIREAAARDANQARGEAREMRYHDFVGQLALLESERSRLSEELRSRATASAVPGFSGAGVGAGLTLGKAGPLEEKASRPVSAAVGRWAKTLRPAIRKLVYPDRRHLRGEGSATEAGEAPASGDEHGDRTATYRPPSDRRNSQPGMETGSSSDDGGGGGAPAIPSGGGGGRATRLGLLIPTGILSAYVLFVLLQLRKARVREAV